MEDTKTVPVASTETKPVEPVKVAEPVAAKEPEKGPVQIYKVPNVFRTKLAHISYIEARDGFLTIYTNDGKTHRKTAEDAREMARECASMLQSMARADLNGIPVPHHIKAQTQELITKLVTAYRTAKHQQETALKMDHATRAVDRMTSNIAWQKGEKPERGEFNTDFLREDANIRHLCARFPMLKEGEIATILRATDVSYGVRMQLLAGMNGKRMMDENKLTAQDVMRIVGGNQIEIPTGVGIKKTVRTEPKIQVQVAKPDASADSKAD